MASCLFSGVQQFRLAIIGIILVAQAIGISPKPGLGKGGDVEFLADIGHLPVYHRAPVGEHQRVGPVASLFGAAK